MSIVGWVARKCLIEYCHVASEDIWQLYWRGDMAHIKISRGLNVPLKGVPVGPVEALAKPQEVSLNLAPFMGTKFKLLARAGDVVSIGQPICEDKGCPGRFFVSPAGGTIKEVRRGLKRRLLDIVIEVDKGEEKQVTHKALKVSSASRKQIVDLLMEGGMFAHIRHRPFNLLADPTHTPRSIFVNAAPSAPCTPSAELQVEGFEEEFQLGLSVLAKLTDGPVHLVYRSGSSLKAFTDAKDVESHTIEGPHPSGNASVHIHNIDPIKQCHDCIWTVDAHDVVSIGVLFGTGKKHLERVIGVGGPGVLGDKTGYFRVREGMPISALIAGRNEKGLVRMISGDVLTGSKVEVDDFLGFEDYCFSVVPENTEREMLHFFRPGLSKFTATKTYLSGHRKDGSTQYDFTTSQHGEERPFIDGAVYEDVMPMQIPTMELVKALVSEDFDTAEELGLLEVDGEDFALPTFICPSKIEMGEIVSEGLRHYAQDVLT